MSGRKALGKGLSALLPDDGPPWPGRREIAPSRCRWPASIPIPSSPGASSPPARSPSSWPRSARAGWSSPSWCGDAGDRYQIIAGERRHRAAQALGLATVPVVVRDVPDDRLLELALVENIQRDELTPLEEAHAYQRLQHELGLTQEEIAKRVGKERSTIANVLRLLRLPREVRELLADGRLDAGHARALLALERAEDQIALAREAARKGLSVREVERRVALLRAPRGKKETRRDPNTRAAEERLRAALGARVEIKRRGARGS